jgi:TfoX/Sxy family transcriptional regulator of competence genes
MAWKRSSPALVEAFGAALPADPRVERRQMFGYPCAFVNGQMFTGLHEERLVVRLDERGRSELLGIPGAEPFEPLPGRRMHEYVVVPPRLVAHGLALREWIERAFAFGLSLPPKGKRSPRPASAPAKPPPAAPAAAKPKKTSAPKKTAKPKKTVKPKKTARR